MRKVFGSILLSIYFFFSNGLLNHAASLSFFFILSFVPMLMFILYASSLLIVNNAVVYQQVLSVVNEINYFVWNSISSGTFNISDFGSVNYGVWGVLALLISSTLFIRSMMRGFDQIFSRPCYQNVFLNYFAPVILNLILVISIVGIVLLNLMMSTLVEFSGMEQFAGKTNVLILLKWLSSLPLVVVFIVSLFLYRILPGRKLRWRLLVSVSLLFSVSVLLFKNVAYGAFVDPSQFSLYGSAGVLLTVLLSFYIFFICFLFWAQFAYVYDNIKVLTIRFFLDASPIVWFRERVIATVVRLAGGHVDIVPNGEVFQIENHLCENVYIVAEGSVVVNGMQYDASENSFFIPSDIESNGEGGVSCHADGEVILIHVPVKMYYELLEESVRLKQRVVATLRSV